MLADLYAEILDACVYSMAAIQEGDNSDRLWGVFSDTLTLAHSVRGMILRRDEKL